MDAERWDVLVIELKTRVVQSVVGERMREVEANRRQATVTPRLNDDYEVVQAPAGQYKLGDVWG
jgi:hypothetical protein